MPRKIRREMAEPPAPTSPPPRGAWARWLVAGLLVLFGFVVAANVYVFASTRGRIVSSPEVAPARPVAIVLGNRVLPDGRPSDTLAERLRVGLALYVEGRVQRVIVSGAFYGVDEYDEPGAMAAWLVRHGVPASAITLDRTGHRTAATMAAVAAMGIREALVCTQGYHLPRALYLARRAGIDATGVAARNGPSEHGERRFRIFLRESLARAESVVETALR
jgi:SanA protein